MLCPTGAVFDAQVMFSLHPSHEEGMIHPEPLRFRGASYTIFFRFAIDSLLPLKSSKGEVPR